MEPETEIELRQKWNQLMEWVQVEAAAARPAFELLLAAYSAPDRHYHNLEHLEDMFHVASRLTSITDDPRALQLAIWFHDAVYDPRASDNEARSGDLAVAALAPLGVPRSTLDVVTRLILATRHPSRGLPPGDRETSILLDADLAILGSPPERYQRYAAGIRKEYSWAPEPEYRKARVAILEQFLFRPRLFWTEALHAECDLQARENMRLEIRSLE